AGAGAGAEPHPRVRGRARRVAARTEPRADAVRARRAHPLEPERRNARGAAMPRRPRARRAVPPSGGPRAARRALPVRRVPCADGGRLMPKRSDLHRILVIGSGPIVIGQACEFDYSGTQACKVLRREGFHVSLVNSNPATIMTDPEFADRTYIEPLTPASVLEVIERERPDVLLPTLGGQTALNVAVGLGESRALEGLGGALGG